MFDFNEVKKVINGEVRHPYYQQSIDKYNEVRVHAYGDYPSKLIEERRPSESKKIQEFRKQFYKCKTLASFDKVINSLKKIRKSADFNYLFNTNNVPKSIIASEHPKEYFLKHYPRWYSIDNWYWSVAFKQTIVDANGISVSFISNPERNDNEYAKPVSIIFNSPAILDYKTDEYYFIKSPEISYYTSYKRQVAGDVYYYIDKEYYYKLSQVNAKGEYSILEMPHNLGYLPVVNLGGVVSNDIFTNQLLESFVISMLPEFDEAVREYSDLQAGVMQSMFPTYWYYSNVKCSSCKGLGQIPSKSGSVQCDKCNGKGEFPFNPFEHISVNLSKTGIGENPPPTPPGGIIEKDTDIIEIQDKRVQDHIYYGLAALNMEHLAVVPLSQSGTAKEWDRDEANSFVYTIAEDTVRFLKETLKVQTDLRYSGIVTDKNKRSLLLPVIEVPSKFDIANERTILEDTTALKACKYPASVIAHSELEYIKKKFAQDSETAELIELTYKLDNLAGQSFDDVLMMSSNGWITELDAFIHANINQLVEKAIRNSDKFKTLSIDQQKEEIKKLAGEQMGENSSVGKIEKMKGEEDTIKE
jgi:hypothetical protein